MYVHIESGKIYRKIGLIDMKDPTTGEWVKGVEYVLANPVDGTGGRYVQSLESWDESFRKHSIEFNRSAK